MIYHQSGDLIYSEETGIICQLSDPTIKFIEHRKLPLCNPIWELGMANGNRIIEAEKCLSLFDTMAEAEEAIIALKLVREMFGANWQEESNKIKEIAERQK